MSVILPNMWERYSPLSTEVNRNCDIYMQVPPERGNELRISNAPRPAFSQSRQVLVVKPCEVGTARKTYG